VHPVPLRARGQFKNWSGTCPLVLHGAGAYVDHPPRLFVYWRYVALVHGYTVASGVVSVGVVVVDVCNRSQMRTSTHTCLIFGVSIGLGPG